MFAEIRSPQTIANLRRNPAIEVIRHRPDPAPWLSLTRSGHDPRGGRDLRARPGGARRAWDRRDARADPGNRPDRGRRGRAADVARLRFGRERSRGRGVVARSRVQARLDSLAARLRAGARELDLRQPGIGHGLGVEDVRELTGALDEPRPGRQREVRARVDRDHALGDASGNGSRAARSRVVAAGREHEDHPAVAIAHRRPTSIRTECEPGRPSTHSPPASSTSSGSQWPGANGGSTHSARKTRGRGGPAVAARSSASSRRMCAGTRARPRSGAPSARTDGLDAGRDLVAATADRARASRTSTLAELTARDRADGAEVLGKQQVGREPPAGAAARRRRRASVLRRPLRVRRRRRRATACAAVSTRAALTTGSDHEPRAASRTPPSGRRGGGRARARRRSRSRSAARRRPHALPAVAEAARDMIVDEPGRLHERVADGRPDEAEPAPLEVLAHRLRLGRSPPGGRRARVQRVRDAARRRRTPTRTRRSCRAPRWTASTRLRVRERRLDLEPVAHDRRRRPSGARRRRAPKRATASGSKPAKAAGNPPACAGSSTTRALPARLRASAARRARARRACGHAPLLVVVGDHRRVGSRPLAARHATANAGCRLVGSRWPHVGQPGAPRGHRNAP